MNFFTPFAFPLPSDWYCPAALEGILVEDISPPSTACQASVILPAWLDSIPAGKLGRQRQCRDKTIKKALGGKTEDTHPSPRLLPLKANLKRPGYTGELGCCVSPRKACAGGLFLTSNSLCQGHIISAWHEPCREGQPGPKRQRRVRTKGKSLRGGTLRPQKNNQVGLRLTPQRQKHKYPDRVGRGGLFPLHLALGRGETV